MPAPRMLWRHVTLNTFCSWFKGSEKGFRAKDHEIHSSGDYKNPPPAAEHEGLREHFKRVASSQVTFDRHLQALVGRALLKAFRHRGYRVLAVAVGVTHVHILVELFEDRDETMRALGDVKRDASREVGYLLPGKVWSRGADPKLVWDRQHQHNAFDYIIYDQGDSAWTWSFRDINEEGVFARIRPLASE